MKTNEISNDVKYPTLVAFVSEYKSFGAKCGEVFRVMRNANVCIEDQFKLFNEFKGNAANFEKIAARWVRLA